MLVRQSIRLNLKLVCFTTTKCDNGKKLAGTSLTSASIYFIFLLLLLFLFFWYLTTTTLLFGGGGANNAKNCRH